MSSWRPPQWGTGTQLYSVTVPNPTTNVQTTITDTDGTAIGGSSSSGGTTTPGGSTTYFFDGVMSSDHYDQSVFTQHPVQSGASIVDHIYAMPSRVVIEGVFSDAMDSYQNGQYSSGSGSKSTNAYLQLLSIKDGRQPLTLATQLKTYTNMQIESIRAPKTYRSFTSVPMTVVFKQIILATTAPTTTSSRPNQSQTTSGNQTQSNYVPPSLLSSHTSTLNAAPPPSAPNIPNPNPNWSSDPVGMAD